MKWDLKTPCKNCPFNNTPAGIKFACRERAEEIEESAYRNGFPCHLSATLDEDAEEAGFEFGEDTQHCAGALIMFFNDGFDGNVPFERLDEDEQDRIRERLNFRAPVYQSIEEFLAASTQPKTKRRKKK